MASTSKSSGSHLVLTNPKNPIDKLTQSKNEPNSLPDTPCKEKSLMTNSQSYDCNIAEMNSKAKAAISPNLAEKETTSTLNTPKQNTLQKTPSIQKFQKYNSFQKPSYSYMDNKCTCFNMPFVCEICTNK